jgi:hypothetical protein
MYIIVKLSKLKIEDEIFSKTYKAQKIFLSQKTILTGKIGLFAQKHGIPHKKTDFF